MDTTKVNIPKKISPDNLIDSYVEFKISTDFNAAKIEKLILETLETNGLSFTKIPFISPTKGLTDKWMYSNGIVRFFIREDKIGINCVNRYIGWKDYLGYIMLIIQSSIEYITVNSIILKYVSKWDNIAIFNVIDGNFDLAQFKRFDGFSVSFKAYRKADSIPKDPMAEVVIKENIILDDVKCSLIDITVSIDCIPIADKEKIVDVYLYLDEVHLAQKDMFFSLLKREFINMLNPVW